MSLREKKFDLAIIGAGVLGTTIAYWLSSLTDASIALIDQETGVAKHTSSRNTGVIHRPFYLDPEKKKTFAACAQRSYFMWRELAKMHQLSWEELGTLEVATNEADLPTLQKYLEWGRRYGMEERELELLDSSQVNQLEPKVRSLGAIHSKTDTIVDYGQLTEAVFQVVLSNGVSFLGERRVRAIKVDSQGIHIAFAPGSPLEAVLCDFLINAAGGGAVDIAHMMNEGRSYTDLHFRGEYWTVGDPFGSSIKRNIYSVARYKEFPFLDPHFIVRPDGHREIGPNAVLVTGPYTYTGLSKSVGEFFGKLFERPMGPKMRLFTNSQFLSLVSSEWKSSLSKKAMCARVRRFLPELESGLLLEHGISGIRSSLIDRKGFVPEAVQLEGDRSHHILNFNSPGATGAPAYSALVVQNLIETGRVASQKGSSKQEFKLWKPEDAAINT